MMLWNRLRVMQGIRSVQSGQCVHGMTRETWAGWASLFFYPTNPFKFTLPPGLIRIRYCT